MVAWYYNGSTPYPASPDKSVVITKAQLTGGNCTSNCTAINFGSMQFDEHSNNLLYIWGNNTDVTSQTTVTPYVINPATGQYTVGTPIVDFQYGMPQINASEWTTSHAYSFGQYVLHTLTAAEMATSGVWTSGHTYAAGDIIIGGTCAYKASVGGTSSGSGPSAAPPCPTTSFTDAGFVKWTGLGVGTAQFVYQETNPACTAVSPCTSAGSAFQWLATPNLSLCTTGTMALNSQTLTCGTSVFTAAMVGQTISVSSVGSAGAVLNTTISGYTSGTSVSLAVPATTAVTGAATVGLTGHPDIISSASGDASGLVWQNSGVAVAPCTSWCDKADMSSDQTYAFTVGGTGYNGPSKFALGTSNNTYHMARSYAGAEDYSTGGAGQDTGFFLVEYDNTLNIYHLLNTLTGIWVDWGCVGGTGYNCSGGTWTSTTVGQLKVISDPFGTGVQPCPGTLHAGRMNASGTFFQMTTTVSAPYKACNSGSGFSNDDNWATTTASFDPYKSMQNYLGGLNHSAFGTNFLYNFGNSSWGYTAGVFVGKFALNNVQGNGTGNPVLGGGFNPQVSAFLAPLNPGGSSQSVAQTVPPGCYITVGGVIKNPDCNLSEVVDCHLSMAADHGTDNVPEVGSCYNYATLSPIPFNAWQGFILGWQTASTVPAGYTPPPAGGVEPPLPTTSFAGPWSFTHLFNSGTSQYFGVQFAVSEYSQDGNWSFWGTDYACQDGSNTGSPPALWSSGSYYQQLMVTAVAAAPLTTTTALCGLPWQANTAYAVGNLINPIEGTGGGGQIDDVFQAIYVSGNSGPISSLGSGQPKCGTTSCFANTNPPLCNGLSCVSNPTATPFTPGDTVCDSTSGTGDVINPSLPYSTSCPTGIVWQDLGFQAARPDVFAVKLHP